MRSVALRVCELKCAALSNVLMMLIVGSVPCRSVISLPLDPIYPQRFIPCVLVPNSPTKFRAVYSVSGWLSHADSNFRSAPPGGRPARSILW